MVERNPPDATFGWGVVFSEETLGALRDADYETYTQISNSFARWSAIDIHFRGKTVRSQGHVFTGISRKVLLSILQRRCRELGVELTFRREVSDLAVFGDADLVVGADGVNGLVRRVHADAFRPALSIHPTKYIWYGANLALDAFTFIFRQNHDGLFQVHAYPFDAHTSTFIVECPESVWRRAKLDTASEADSIAYCEELFGEELNGRRLLSNRSAWINFVTLRSESWHHGNVVLLGDAAHTAHFSIGSGTKLAMEDSIALVDALRRHRDLTTALNDYELERQPVVERFQEAARESSTYFENVSRYAAFEPVQFAFNLLTRSRRISHVNLSVRDPELVRAVDGLFFSRASGRADGIARLAPPPMFAPFTLRSLTLANRTVLVAPNQDSATEGMPEDRLRDALLRCIEAGAGLVLTEQTAVSPEGRVTSGSPGIYRAEHGPAWTRIVEDLHERGGRIALQLGHAGRRGSTRPRSEGIDRPLPMGAWQLVSASAIPYRHRSSAPRAIDRRAMATVVAQFGAAARAASSAGFDLLELNFGQGYLVASFLSPLSNRRDDAYGGGLEHRMRFAMEVLDAVRAAWPGPLAVRMTASDWVAGGFDLDDAVTLAATLKAHGCDLVDAVMGQNVVDSRPDYGRLFGVPASDQIRNEAGIPTIASGHITTFDEANTILAAGRADLCVMPL